MTNQPDAIWIYTDGSAITKKQSVGTFAAIIVLPDGTHKFLPGAMAWTKINRMELSALNQALYYLWVFHFKKGSATEYEIPQQEIDARKEQGLPPIFAPRRKFLPVQVLTDSMYVCNGAVKPEGRYENRDLWAQFEELRWHFDLSIQHYGRNADPRQNQCDSACTSLRVLFQEWVDRFLTHPAFETFEMTRKSVVMKELPEGFDEHGIAIPTTSCTPSSPNSTTN